jgi:PAS domain S-box-containing protein
MDAFHLLEKVVRALAEADADAGVAAIGMALAEHGPLEAGAVAAAQPTLELLRRVATARAAEHEETRCARERAQLLSEASFEGIMIHVDGVIVDANQRLVELTGYELSEIIGTDLLHRCVVPEEVASVLQRVRDRIEGDYVVTALRKDGTRYRAEILSKQSKLGERPVRVAAVRDVTERERIQSLVRESQLQLRNLAETAFDLLGYSRDGVIVDLVGDVERFGGLPREAWIGRRIVDTVTPEYQSLVAEHVQQNKRGAFRCVLVTPQGEQIPAEIVAVSTTIDGLPTRLAGIRDLRAAEQVETERRRLEQHVQQSQRLDSLGVLAGGIAHDFNNLLVGIIGSAELLAASNLSSADRESVQAIAEAGQRAATLTAQLLAYAGRRDLGERGPIDLGVLFAELRRLLAPTFAKSAELSFDIEPGCVVLGNRATVLQVLMNLLTNASDAIGSAPGTVSVTARRVATPGERFKHALGASLTKPGGPWVLIEVEDTGSGMDEATRGRIFEPFFSTKAKGHGLGLAACLGIVSSHGGAIVVETELGRGSTFSVLLPASEGPSQKTVGRSATLSSARVLVVDDEPIVRRQVRRMLEAQGYAVLDAADGRAALTSMERDRPDLVVLDVTMPGLDGTEVVREARSRGLRTPIILCSGYADFRLETRLQADAYAAFLAKPFTLEALLAAVKKALVR